MKKILLLLLITTASYSQTLLKLKSIEYAPGANYCTVTNSLGVQTYTPCSSLSSTVIPTLQQVTSSGNTSSNDIEAKQYGTGVTIGYGGLLVDGISTTYLLDADYTNDWVKYKNNEVATIDQLPTITASTNITVSGTSPNYTVSSPSQSLSISGNTISLSDSGGSVVIPTQTTGLASTTDLANKGNSQPIYSGKRRTIPFASLPAASGGYHNTVWYVPYIVSSTHTITDIGIEVTTGAAASNVRLALYSDNNGVPGTLIEESGAISSVGTGLKTYTFSSPIVLSASSQIYWMALQASLTGIGLRQGNSSICNLYINGTGSFGPMYYQTQAFGSFPASATPVGVTSQVALLISLKAQ